MEFGGVADVVIGKLAGEFEYLSKRFWKGFSGMVEKCGKLEIDCGWNSFSVRWVWNFSVSLAEKKTMFIPKIEHCLD